MHHPRARGLARAPAGSAKYTPPPSSPCTSNHLVKGSPSVPCHFNQTPAISQSTRAARTAHSRPPGVLPSRHDSKRLNSNASSTVPLQYSSSEHTANLDCQHFDQCSGCSISTGIDSPPLLQRAFSYFAELGFPDFSLTVGSVHGWRCRARLVVRGETGAPIIGLYRAGSHDAVAISDCRVHHPRINEATEAVRRAVATLRIPPYREDTGSGSLRYLQLTAVGSDTERPTAQSDPAARVQIVLVWNAAFGDDSSQKSLAELASHLWMHHGPHSAAPLLHSVWVNFQPSRGNTILSSQWQLLHAGEAAQDDYTWQMLGGARVAFAPGSFMQANFGAMDTALAAIAAHVPPGSAVADLHCGVGTIGLSLAASGICRSVHFVEINPECEAPYKAAAQCIPSHVAVSFTVAAAGSDAGSFLADADVVCVDPPRKGLETSLLTTLCASSSPPLPGHGQSEVSEREEAVSVGCPAHTLIYLSCGYKALERDCAVLLGSGQWNLKHCEAFAFFPATDAIETLAVFQRAGR